MVAVVKVRRHMEQFSAVVEKKSQKSVLLRPQPMELSIFRRQMRMEKHNSLSNVVGGDVPKEEHHPTTKMASTCSPITDYCTTHMAATLTEMNGKGSQESLRKAEVMDNVDNFESIIIAKREPNETAEWCSAFLCFL